MKQKMTEKVLEIKKFETLYGISKDNKIKSWEIRVERYSNYSEIITLYGYTKKIETKRRIDFGKNLNKSNATTHYQQAISEAFSKWNKKQNIEQYTQDFVLHIDKLNINNNTNNNTNANTNANDNANDNANTNGNFEDKNKEMGSHLPMLAQDYSKQKQKIKFPCYVQPKLDGFRNIYNTTMNKNTTRQGKEFSIIAQSGKLYEELCSLPKGLILDGEFYTNKINFEGLGVLRKTKKLTNTEINNLQKIEYHIYDIIDTKLTFEQRNSLIKNLHLENYEKLIYVPTFLVSSEKEIQQYHIKFLEHGFEGTMIRNSSGMYKEKFRSYDLLKYKDFQDGEFEIIDFTFEIDISGKDQNLIVWIVKVPSENTNIDIKCKVRPMGTKEERKALYKKCKENFNEFKGRKLWVKYFEKTHDGNLRFPTTKCNSYTEYIRDDII